LNNQDEMKKMMETGIPYDRLEVETEDGVIESYWIIGATDNPDDKCLYALLSPASKDAKGNWINPDDQEGNACIIVREETEPDGEKSYAQIDPDTEVDLCTKIMDKLHAEGWIRYPEDDEAEAAFNKAASQSMAKSGNKDADVRMAAAVDKVTEILNKQKRRR
jgi:hypothetical protein